MAQVEIFENQPGLTITILSPRAYFDDRLTPLGRDKHGGFRSLERINQRQHMYRQGYGLDGTFRCLNRRHGSYLHARPKACLQVGIYASPPWRGRRYHPTHMCMI